MLPSSSRVAIASLLLAATGIAGCDRQSAAPAQGNVADASVATADEVTSGEATSGEVGGTATPAAPQMGIDRSHRGDPAPSVSFTARDGKPTTLAAFRGKPCPDEPVGDVVRAVCRRTADAERRAASYADKIHVLAVSQDTQKAAEVPQFLNEHGATALAPYVDDQMGLSLGYGANLPTTILFDSAGKEVWRWHGGNDWTSARSKVLIAEAA